MLTITSNTAFIPPEKNKPEERFLDCKRKKQNGLQEMERSRGLLIVGSQSELPNVKNMYIRDLFTVLIQNSCKMPQGF